jgi:hypothetical protein
MTKLYVTEYAGLMPSPVGGQGQIPLEPPLAEQVVDYTGGVATSAAFNSKTRLVRIETDATCSVVFGTAPTATTSNGRFAANGVEFRGVPIGQSFKVSAITNT